MIKIEKHDKKSKLIGSVGTYVGSVNKKMLKHSQGHQNGKKTTCPWTCHYCKRKGHIRPFCYKLYGYLEHYGHKSHEPEVRNVKKEWMPKSNNVGLMVHTSKKSSSNDIWYFDSGCSRHMTGKNSYFENMRSCDRGYVTFGDESKGKILGIGNVISDELPKLDNVLLVEGLDSNLISISQLCDEGMKVNFNKFGCQITNEEGEVSMRGIRTKNDCYKWIHESEGQSDMLHTALKHQKIQAVPHFGSKDERRIVFESSITLKNNRIKVLLHSIKDSVEKNGVPT